MAGTGEFFGDMIGIVILAILIVRMVQWCLKAAGEAGQALADGLGGDIPAAPTAPDDVQALRDAGAL